MLLTEESFKHLLSKKDGISIKKKRYKIPDTPYLIELDVFEGDYNGFCMAEVEFPDIDSANAYNAPAWFGPEVTKITGARNISVNTDILIEDIKEEADMLVLPGGMPGTNYLRDHEGLAELLKKQYEAGKWVAAICAAPSVFGGLGFLKDRKATSYPGCLDGIPVGEYTEEPVAVMAM